MKHASRREFLKQSLSFSAAAVALASAPAAGVFAGEAPAAGIRFGLVTYQWARNWDLPTLLRNCQTTKLLGVELRTTHAHGVEPKLTAEQRADVKKRFSDSPVTLLGLGTIQDFHTADPAALAKSIEDTKAWIKLGHDVGASGVKVRPNDLPRNVPQEKTIEQIGKSLNTVAAFAADYGQQIRLEVHGGCARLPIIKAIFDVATHPNAAVCWNSNDSDQEAPGLESNFNLVKARLGATTHVRELDTPGYAWQELAKLFVKAKYQGWWLLEAGSADPADPIKAIMHQKDLFDQYLAKATA